MAPSATDEQLAPQEMYGLVSCSAGSADSGQELGYRRTAYAPPQTISPPISQFFCLLQPLQPFSPPSKTAVCITTRQSEGQYKTHGTSYQAYQFFSLSAYVVHVIRQEEIVGCVLQLFLLACIVRMISQ